MGTTASAKIIAIPIMEKPPEPAPTVATEALPEPLEKVTPVALDVPVAEPEPVPTGISLHKLFRDFLANFTRDRIISALLGGISIAALFLFWYFGTKYRL